jgi:nucleotide-binding universal stress UspA family protein
MKILFAADGSSYTKKALAFLVTHEGLAGKDDELIVLNVQPPVPPRVGTILGADAVAGYHREEAEKVLDPIKSFLGRHTIPFRCSWVVGSPCDQILEAAETEKVHLIVLGTHGYGLVGRVLMGSIAQRVVARCEVPVLLVK